MIMIKFPSSLALIFSLVNMFVYPSAISEASTLKQPVRIEIEAHWNNTKPHLNPIVKLHIINTSKRTIKYISPNAVSNVPCRLGVFQNGKKIDVPIAIADPGPGSPKDIVSIKPNETHNYIVPFYPEDLSSLPTGIYQVKAVIYDHKGDRLFSEFGNLVVP